MFHRISLETYDELKDALLSGSHMEAVGYLNNCINSDDVFPDGDSFVLGFQISRFEIHASGQPDHYIINGH